ncbi:hypothetical protein OEZ86_005135 [Tetradesmus obliquus]|nr:hypothetical protein OEZ86_005135 [Tetradesmus obliquus]
MRCCSLVTAAADAAVTAAASNNNANCGPAGTCPLERLKGTFSLPSNKAFTRADVVQIFNRTRSTTRVQLNGWRQIFKFHFVQARSGSDYVDWRVNGFPEDNKRVSLLGTRRKDTSDNYALTFEYIQETNTRQIKYTGRNGGQFVPKFVPIEQASVQTTPHTVHKISTRMRPPCEPNC